MSLFKTIFEKKKISPKQGLNMTNPQNIMHKHYVHLEVELTVM